MKPKIKLMPDYFCFPLWGMDEDNLGDIDPKTLPLSQTTIDKLETWAKIYDMTLNQEDPSLSGFSSQRQKQAFEEEGIELWQQIRQELAKNYEVYYFSIFQQKVVENPNHLTIVKIS